MFDSSDKTPTVKLEVEIELDNGKCLTGSLWLKPQGRVTDMLNNDRAFLPFETMGGKFMVLKKSAFTSVTPLVESGMAYQGNNPFQILGVSDSASFEDIKQAYHKLCTENHPDRLSGAGMSQEYVDLATTRFMWINDAYSRIQKQFDEKRNASAA